MCQHTDVDHESVLVQALSTYIAAKSLKDSARFRVQIVALSKI